MISLWCLSRSREVGIVEREPSTGVFLPVGKNHPEWDSRTSPFDTRKQHYRDAHLHPQGWRSPARLGRHRRHRRRSRPSGFARRYAPAWQAQADLRNHIDSGDFVIIVNADKVALTGQKLQKEAGLPPLGLPGRPEVGHLRRAPREEPGSRCGEGHPWHAPQEQPRPPAADQAQGVRRCRAPARRAAAADVHPSTRSPSKRRKDLRTYSWLTSRTPPKPPRTSRRRLRRPTWSRAAPRPVLSVPGAAVGRRKQAIAPRAHRPRLGHDHGQRPHDRGLLPEQAAPAADQRPVHGAEPHRCIRRHRAHLRGGPSGQAGALRLGIARSLNGIDEENNRPTLKKAGFLSRDARVKERKKAGLKKARKAPQYSKR